MFSLRTPSATLAGLAVAVLTFLPGMAHAEDWRAARSMPELVEVLEGWLDAHSPWPRRADAPRVRWTNAQSAAAMAGHAARSAALNPRGFYDADIATIFYAGHGSQMWDESGDEDDGLDETLALGSEDVVVLHLLVAHDPPVGDPVATVGHSGRAAGGVDGHQPAQSDGSSGQRCC